MNCPVLATAGSRQGSRVLLGVGGGAAGTGGHTCEETPMEMCERTHRRVQKREHMEKNVGRPTWRKGRRSGEAVWKRDIAGITAGDSHLHAGAGTPLKGWGPMEGPTPGQRSSKKQGAVEENQ